MASRRWLLTVLYTLNVLCEGHFNEDPEVKCDAVIDQSSDRQLHRSSVEVTQPVDLQTAKHMQNHNLEILFKRYGENGTISITGLRKLLKSIGIDNERKVHHKHEHGKNNDHHHSGASKHEQHHLHHHHSHQHQHDIPASKKGADIPKGAKGNTVTNKKSEHSNRDHNTYNKKVFHEISTTPAYTSNILLKTSEIRNPRSINDVPALEENQQATTARTGLSGPPIQPTTEQPLVSNFFVSSDHNLPPQIPKDHSGSEDTDDHSHDHHDHECLNASRILSSHGMNMEMILTYTDFTYLCPALLNQIDFKSCIVHASDLSKSNDSHHVHKEEDHETELRSSDPSQKSNSIKSAWIGGFLSITIISMLSLLGVILIPLMNRVFFKFLLSFLVALAVGTLSGDALLHLIPHSQGNHYHNHGVHEVHEPDHDHDHDHAEGAEEGHNLDSVWKGLTALGGVYFMFLIEHFITLGKMYKEKKQKNHKKWDAGEEEAKENRQKDKEDLNIKTSEDAENNFENDFINQAQFAAQHSSGTPEEEEVMLAPTLTQDGYNEYTAQDCENKCHSHFHDTIGQADDLHHHHHDYHHILHHHHSQNHHPHSHSHHYSREQFKGAGIATLAWMIIMGDGLHNFSDGLAIGAAFSEGISSGLSTSVAVFCHELPHELGDFAVLLKAGMTVRQAILYNLLSAMMGYLGMITGILIGHYAENISMWVFALTAGLFMYVALVDMVPEMLHNDAGDHGFSHCGYFLLQNAGILLGFGIMLVIAVFEDKILLDVEL
ncbi:zinc transporter ZIP6 [Polypterus senegalus]